MRSKEQGLPDRRDKDGRTGSEENAPENADELLPLDPAGSELALPLRRQTIDTLAGAPPAVRF
jgi:hypothetical protein